MLRAGKFEGIPADVWSFACIAVCVLQATEHAYVKVPTGQQIDTTVLPVQRLEAYITNGKLGPMADSAVELDCMCRMVHVCSRLDPSTRPSFAEVREYLAQFS